MVNRIEFKKKLLELNMTIQQLSETSGVSVSSINRYIREKEPDSPKADAIVKLCQAMNINDDTEKVLIFLN